MKNYTITVNGNTYDVSVEENRGDIQTDHVVQAAPVAQAKAKAPTPKVAQAPKAESSSSNSGGIKINSPMPGKIISLKASPGQAVKKGEVIVILEAMKMENEIVASEDGTIVSINVTAGQSVEAGEVLATLN